MTRVLRFALAAALSIGAAAPAAQPGVAGTWRLSIDFHGEARDAGVEIKVDGRAVTGRLVAGFVGGEVPIEGEFAGGTLTFSASTTGGPHPGAQLDFSATLTEGGTLDGSMSAPFGDFKWTAERLR